MADVTKERARTLKTGIEWTDARGFYYENDRRSVSPQIRPRLVDAHAKVQRQEMGDNS